MKRKNKRTTQITVINNTTGEIEGFVNKGRLAKEFNVERETVVNWFRYKDKPGLKKKVNIDINGYSYTLLRLDRYYSKYN